MKLQYDRELNICVGASRKAINWQNCRTSVSSFYTRFEEPTRSTETQQEYFNKSRAEQDELKDVGGYVGGELKGGRRKANNMSGRDLITIDFDNVPSRGTAALIEKIEALNISFCLHSTRKHIEATKPRLRVIVPADRTMTVDEYEPCARRLAEYIGIQMADPTTFQAERLMYWPSCSSDGEYVFRYKDAPLVSVDALLRSYTENGGDWRDVSKWPQVPGYGADAELRKRATKQGDPETKQGIVGAFCRTYDIYSALTELIPGIYEPVDNDTNRYTYVGGSTTGGAVLYDNGKFLFSHHATDPCSGLLVNAFDLVRLHKYGELDNAAKPNTPGNRLPSYDAMCEFANTLPAVVVLMAKERREAAVRDFEDVAAGSHIETTDWLLQLQTHPKSGQILPTIDNVKIILENDELLKDKFVMNEFANRGEILCALPWIKDSHFKRRLWTDSDSDGLYWYLEKAYNIPPSKSRIIDAALSLHSEQHKINEVQDYLNGLAWDGKSRLDTLLTDYLGAVDDEYTRAVCRKSFTAAVARAMVPGCKFDNMLILCGPQGIGKSTLIDKMSRGWFNDSIRTFEGKEASELLPGVWLVEVAELDAFRKTDVSRIKQFLSLRADRYRAAYGRRMSEFPRRCVFFGTCNQMEFLQDATGNRRFWPVDVGVIPRTKNAWDLDDSEINQIWAEAKMRWQIGEALYLSGELEEVAQNRQEQHRDASPTESLIEAFVNSPVPEDWDKWPIDRRRDFWAAQAQGDYKLVERKKVCALEVWCELFNNSINTTYNPEYKKIAPVIARMRGWKRTEKPLYFGPCYKTQRCFIRAE